jgi:hypothetical protein
MTTRSASEDGGSGRLKSVFTRSPLSNITGHDGAVGLGAVGKLKSDDTPRPSSLLHHQVSQKSTSSDSSSNGGSHSRDSKPTGVSIISRRMRAYSQLERIRPRSSLGLSKGPRSPVTTTPIDSPLSQSFDNDRPLEFDPEKFYGAMIYHAEVQTSNFGWRKKSEYFVLTTHFLLRYKSAKKAAEVFPMAFPVDALTRRRTGLSTSLGSTHDFPRSASIDSPTDSALDKSCIPLQHLLSIQIIVDSPARTTLELVWQCPGASFASHLSMLFDRTPDQPSWLEYLRDAVEVSRSAVGYHVPPAYQQVIRDTLPGNDVSEVLGNGSWKAYAVVHRGPSTVGGSYASLEDAINKDPPFLSLLVIGKQYVRKLPLAKPPRNASRPHSEALSSVQAFSLVSLALLSVGERDDSFDLVFR